MTIRISRRPRISLPLSENPAEAGFRGPMVQGTDYKRVVLAVCTGWMGSEMMASCRKQRVLVGYR